MGPGERPLFPPDPYEDTQPAQLPPTPRRRMGLPVCLPSAICCLLLFPPVERRGLAARRPTFEEKKPTVRT